MSILSNLKTDDNIKNETDSVGGGNCLESGLYPVRIATAYLQKSKGGALSVVVTMKTQDNNELSQTFWVTSGDSKGNRNYYEKDGVKNYLPGFNQMNSLCLLTVGKELSELDVEEKVVNVYSFEAGAKVPTTVPMIMDLIGAEVIVGLLKQTVDKNVKDAAGNYVPSGDTRDENEVDKLFHATSRRTTSEIRSEAAEATFINDWEAKWAGKTKNKAKGAAGTEGALVTKPTQERPTKSLFG